VKQISGFIGETWQKVRLAKEQSCISGTGNRLSDAWHAAELSASKRTSQSACIARVTACKWQAERM